MPKTLYIACPAYAMHGPLDHQKMLESAGWFAARFGLGVVPSPLLGRHLGRGAWLPAVDRGVDLAEALRHDVVWACRGGFGSIELLPALLASRRRSAPPLIGYSDHTVLHAAWHVRGWGPHLYGAIPQREAHSRQGASLVALASGEGLKLSHAVEAGARALRPGRARGPLFPACLSVLAGLCGTAAQPDLRGHVLAVEDIAVRPFLVDSNLNQLHLSGALDGVVGLLGGSFTGEERPDYLGPTFDEVLAAWAARLRVPLVTRLPFGHLDDALVLPYGRTATLTARADGEWSLNVAAGEAVA